MLKTFTKKINDCIEATEISREWQHAKDSRKMLEIMEQSMNSLIALKGIEKEVHLGWQEFVLDMSTRIKI